MYFAGVSFCNCNLFSRHCVRPGCGIVSQWNQLPDRTGVGPKVLCQEFLIGAALVYVRKRVEHRPVHNHTRPRGWRTFPQFVELSKFNKVWW